MGIPLRFFNPSNYRAMVDIAKISSGLDKHMTKKCAYCDLELGLGDTYPVIEFVDHMATKHAEKISPDEIKKYKKIIEKATR